VPYPDFWSCPRLVDTIHVQEQNSGGWNRPKSKRVSGKTGFFGNFFCENAQKHQKGLLYTKNSEKALFSENSTPSPPPHRKFINPQ